MNAAAPGVALVTGGCSGIGRAIAAQLGAPRCAARSAAAVVAGRAVCTPGLLNRAMRVLAAATPRAVVDLVRRHAPPWLPRADRQAT